MVYNKILINSKTNSKNDNNLIKNKFTNLGEYGLIRSKSGKFYKLPSIYLKNKKPNQYVGIKIIDANGQSESETAIILSTNTKESNAILNSKNKLNYSSIKYPNLASNSTNNPSTASSNKLTINKINSPTISTSKLPNNSITISTSKLPNNSINIPKSKLPNNSPTSTSKLAKNSITISTIRLPNNPPPVISNFNESNRSPPLSSILKEKSTNTLASSSSNSSTITSDEMCDELISKENLDIVEHNKFNCKENVQIKSNSQLDKVSTIENCFKTNYNNLQDSTSLELKFSTRDYLISILNKFSNILNNNQNLTELMMNKLRKDNSNLITILSNLKLIISTQQSNNQILNLNKDHLELKFDKRLEIIQLLIMNLDFLQMNNQVKTDEMKRDLLNDNGLLIQNLLDISSNVKDIVYDKDEDVDRSIDIMKEVNLLKELYEQNLANKEQSKSEYNYLKSKLLEIKTELNFRSEIEFEYVIDNVSNLLNSLNENKNSKVFYCRNIPFTLGVLVIEKMLDNKPIKVMEFFLRCKYKEEITDIDWSLRSCFFLTLFSNLPCKNRIINVPNIEFSNVNRLTISNYFLKLEDLIDPSNKFIKNDQLVIGLKIRCERLISH